MTKSKKKQDYIFSMTEVKGKNQNYTLKLELRFHGDQTKSDLHFEWQNYTFSITEVKERIIITLSV